MRSTATALIAATLAWLTVNLTAQESGKRKKAKKRPATFQWVNAPKGSDGIVRHGTFKSPSMGIHVGYSYYLPPGYANSTKRYPVVYHLHGGRPGNERKSTGLASFVDQAIRASTISPTIYVFPNGGPVSWYNMPEWKNAMGEDVFVKELIPHVDKSLSTIARREGRAIEGFSQGGRGTTRIMFRHPELFCSVAPGGSGYGPEKRIQENGGAETEKLKFAPGYDAWTLAKKFATKPNPNPKPKPKPKLEILLWVGTKGFNYEANLEYSKYLDSLGLRHRKLVVEGAPHSAKIIYENKGIELMRFHQKNFQRK